MEPKELPDDTKAKIKDNKFFYQRNKYVFDFALETWYYDVIEAGVTPKTFFLPLSMEDITALYNLCRDTQKNAAVGTTYSQTGDKEKANEVATRIDKAIKSFGGNAFVKLSTRSPKDSLHGKINNRMKDALMEALKESDETPNGDTIAFVTATRTAAKVSSGEEALNLLLLSQRIKSDLYMAIEFPDAFNLQVLVREWIPMRPDYEFRAFVFGNKLNAISQYCYYQHFPHIVSNREKIRQKLITFWESVKDMIKQDNYIMDVVITDDDRALIIELNPFFNDTSACLFNWREPVDRKILKEGTTDIPLRLLEKPVEDPMGCLGSDWRSMIEDIRGINKPKSAMKESEEEKTCNIM